MPKSTLDIILRVKEELSESVRGIRKELKGFEKGFKETSKTLGDWGKGITAVGVGLGALLIKTGMTAARVEVLGTAMNVMGRTAGYTTEQMKRYEEEVKDLGITTRKAREILGGFISAELDLAQATDLARTAQNLAVFANENSSVTAAKLTEAIGSQSVMMLRQYQITTTSTEIFKEYASLLGKTADQLTTAEKKQAFLNKILQEGTKYAGLYEEAMGDVGKQLTSLPRLIETFEEEFGKAFLPVMEKAVQVANDFFKAYNRLTPEMKEMITQTTIMATAFLLAVGGLSLLASKLGAFAKSIGFALKIVAKLGSVMNLFIAALLFTTTKIAEVVIELKKFGDEVGGMERAWILTMLNMRMEVVKFAIVVVEAFDKVADRVPWLNKRIDTALRWLGEELEGTEREFNALATEGVKAFDSVKDSIDETNKSIEKTESLSKKMVDSMIDGLNKLADRFWGLSDEEVGALQDVISARKERMEIMETEWMKYNDLTEANLEFQRQHSEEYKKHADAVEKAEQRIREIRKKAFIYPVEEVIREAAGLRAGIEERIGGLGIPTPTRPPLFEPVAPTPAGAVNTFSFNFEGAFIGNIEDFKKQVIDLINRESELKVLGGQ